MTTDDDDDVALDDSPGAEAEANDPVVAAGGPVTAVLQPRRGARPISDAVRRVFAESMAKAKAKGATGEEEGGLEPVEHEDLPADGAQAAVDPGPADPPKPADPPPPVAAAPPVEPPKPADAPPPAPSLDPEVMRLRAELDQQRQSFEAEKQKFFEDNRTSDLAKLRDTYFDKGAPAITEVIKQWMPGLSDDEMRNEVADLIQDLAHQYLEAPLEQTVKDRIATKRTRAGLKAWKAEQDRLEEERQKKLLASQEEENRARVRRILHQEVTKPEHVSQYPWLASETNAGDLVYEVIDTQYRKDGTQLTWQDAAKRANDWLQQQALAFYDKRKHLLSPQPPPQPAPSETQRAQGDTQVRRSHAPPKPPAPPPQEARPQKWTPEMHRRNTMNKFRGKIQALHDEE